MAIEKRISLTLDTSDATTKINALKASIASATSTASSSSSKPFDSVSTGAKTAKKTLIEYNGALTNSERIITQSIGATSLAEKATLKYDTALRKIEKAYDENILTASQYNTALASASKANELATAKAKALDTRLSNTSGFKVMKGSLTQMSYQLQDVAVQAQMGTNAFIILGQQGPQIASLLGPMGAVIGVAIAVGAAVGGTALTAFLGMNDAGKDLEKTLDSLSDTMEKTESGGYALSDSVYELGKSSSAAQTLKLALAQFQSVNALDLLKKDIEQNTNSISSSFFGLINDIDIQELSDQFDLLDSKGVSSLDDLNSKLETMKNATSTRVAVNALSDLRSSLSAVSGASENVAEEFGLAAPEAETLLRALSEARLSPTISNLNSLDSTVQSLFNSVGTGEQGKAFAEFAQSILDTTTAGRKLNEQMETLKNGPFGDLEVYVDNTQLANAALNDSFNDTSALISSIASEQSRLNDLVKAGAANTTTAQSYLDENTVQLIGEAVSEYDTMNERVKLLNDLKSRGIELSASELTAINAYAQKQNFVYEKQLSYNNSLEENSEILSEVFTKGADDYSKSVSNYNESLQSLVTSTFSSLTDAIVDFAVSGEASFTDFANSVLEDLLRIQVQAEIASLATGISSLFSSSSTGSDYLSTSSSSSSVGIGTISANAKGNAFTSAGQLSRYASGGITGMANSIQSTPKYFASGGGLVGESAQSEAILPLTRTSGGDLGVKTSGGSSSAANVNVNITNSTGSSMSMEQTGTTTNSDGSIDVNMIAKLVNKTISSGQADKSMQNRYNLNRRAK